jgi:hypothetical protein
MQTCSVQARRRILTNAQSITGLELRQLVFEKWGRSYDVRLQRRGRRIYLHVMWKHLEQQSFPLSEEEYDMQLQAGEIGARCNRQQQDTAERDEEECCIGRGRRALLAGPVPPGVGWRVGCCPAVLILQSGLLALPGSCSLPQKPASSQGLCYQACNKRDQ